MDGVRPDAGVLDLGQQRLAQVRVRTVLVVGQLREQRVDLADPLPAFLAYESSLRHLGERAMRHRHRPSPSITRASDAARAARSGCGSGSRPSRPFLRRWVGRGRSAVLLGDGGEPRVHGTRGEGRGHVGRRVHRRLRRPARLTAASRRPDSRHGSPAPAHRGRRRRRVGGVHRDRLPQAMGNDRATSGRSAGGHDGGRLTPDRDRGGEPDTHSCRGGRCGRCLDFTQHRSRRARRGRRGSLVRGRGGTPGPDRDRDIDDDRYRP